MINQSRLNIAACIVLLLLDLCGITLIALAHGQGIPDGILLEPGKPVERELAGGQAHYYQITAAAGNYMHLIVDQRGIDVVVALYGPDGKKLIEVDSPNGAYGPEPLSAIVDAAGSYRLEVRSLEKSSPAGRYEARITDFRKATAQDHSLVLAERVYADGRMLESRGDGESLRKAVGKYEEALKLYRLAGDRRREGDTLNQIASVKVNLGDNRDALDYYNQTLSLRRAAGDRGGEAATLHDLGSVYYYLGEKQKALDYYTQAVPLWRALGDRNGEAITLNGLGLDYDSLGEKQKALDYYNQALPLSRALGNRGGEALTLSNLGRVYSSLDEKQKALDYYNQALPLRRALGDRRAEAGTLNDIGAVYESLGERRKALDYYNQAVLISRAVGDRKGEAGTLNNIGSIFDSLDEKQKALDYYNQSLQLSRAVDDRRAAAVTLNNIGSVYDFLGERQQALDYYNRALPLSRALGDRRVTAATLNNIGLVYNSLGEKQQALEYYNQAIPLWQALGNRSGEATTLNNIGKLYDNSGQNQISLNYFNQALSLNRAAGDRSGEAATLNVIGNVYYTLGEKQQALDYFNHALPLWRAVGDRGGEAAVQLGIARAESAQGQLLDARSHIETALNIIESLRTKVVSPELRSSFFATTQDYYEFDIDLLMRLHKLHPDQGYDREALHQAERARARSLLEGLAEGRLEIRSGADPALIERERELGQLLNAKTDRQIRLLNSKQPDQQAAAVAGEIEALTSQYQELEAEIRAKSPRYAALTQPQPLKPEEIQQQVVDDRTLLLEYFLGKERSYLWVVSANSVRSYELPKREEIEGLALEVKKLLTARAMYKNEESLEQWQARVNMAEAKYRREAARLSRMILGPSASELGSGKRLAIVPDGELQEVAFGALPLPRAGAGRRNGWLPMITEHEIASLPSASALAVIRRETAGRKPAAKGVAVLADPVFDKDDERLKLRATRSGKAVGTEMGDVAGRNLQRALREVMGGEAMSGKTGIPRLPFSRAEADAILSVTPKAASLKALDFKASRLTATSGELSQYRIVHFATHGLLDKVHPELSGVVLSLVDREGKPQDGFLQLHDVYNLNLPAELVVLSACQTGLGKSVRGEGVVGLTRGFMYAGTKRVVASLWEIDDLATAELMKRFYLAMLGEKGMRPAAALRAAQVEMWKQKRWRSPYYWAGFTLYGEW